MNYAGVHLNPKESDKYKHLNYYNKVAHSHELEYRGILCRGPPILNTVAAGNSHQCWELLIPQIISSTHHSRPNTVSHRPS